MSRDRRYKPRAKVVQQMTRHGAVERDVSTGETARISNRERDISYAPSAPSKTPAHADERPINRPNEGKKRKKRRHRHRSGEAVQDTAPPSNPIEQADLKRDATDSEAIADAPDTSRDAAPSSTAPPPSPPRRDTAPRREAVRHPPSRNPAPTPRQPPGGRHSKLRFREHEAPPTAKAAVKKQAAELSRVGGDKLHQKISEVEGDNVGVKGAHTVEKTAESATRSAYRYAKKRAVTRNAPKHKLSYKRKLKKNYAEKARQTKRAAQNAKKSSVSAAKAVTSFVRRHPVAALVLVLVVLLVYMIMSMISIAANLGSGAMGGILTASYLAEDADIIQAELAYTEWETDLLLQIANVETTHLGYDEYRYNIGAVGHDPYALMAYLTSVFQAFTYNGVSAELQSLFDEQYSFTLTPITETRYTADANGTVTPYDWNVLAVSLVVTPLSSVVYSRMDTEQLALHTVLLQSLGGRQYVGSPFSENWLPYVSSRFGYRIHPISGVKDYHMGIDIALPFGTTIQATHDGTVAFAGYDSAYGYIVVLDNGCGLVTKYAHCNTLSVAVGQAVTMGSAIATVGNTGNSTGAHLHFEIIKDGQYLNPSYFAHIGG